MTCVTFVCVSVNAKVLYYRSAVRSALNQKMEEHSESQSSEQARPQGWGALKQYVLDHKVEVALWVTRISTIMFTSGYFVPLLG